MADEEKPARKRATAEQKAAILKNIERAMRLRVARTIIVDVWREAGCPDFLEQPLRDYERGIMEQEKKLLESA